ncbi:MAG: hypothetical protein KA226_09015 [Gemmatimonadales bacterium]|nr:hypothetical protein [Gemmatimonadales bacterium]
MAERGVVWSLLRRLFLWHTCGVVLGAVGFGLGFYTSVLLGPTMGSELIAAALYMAVMGLIVFTVLTPVAVGLLGIWTYAAWRLPRLEPTTLVLQTLVLSVVALLLMVPLAIGTMLLLGMRGADDGRSALAIVVAALLRDWPVVFTFLPAALGWFVAPRLLVPSLRGRFVISDG